MGKTLLGLIIENEKFNLSSSTCLPNEDEVGIDIGILVGKAKISKELNTDTSSLFQNSDVLIDFTVPEATMFHARKCYENNLSIVIDSKSKIKESIDNALDKVLRKFYHNQIKKNISQEIINPANEVTRVILGRD